MNAIHLTGRLTRDPDLRQLPSGASVCKMRLAVDRMGRSNSTGYIDVTSFGRPAEAGDLIRIDVIHIVPRRLPRHLPNVWHG